MNPELGEGEQVLRRRRSRRGGRLATTLFQAALLVAAITLPNLVQPRVAHADAWSDASGTLDSFEKELPTLAAITPPERATLSSGTKGSRLTEAQVAFGVGNFDTAAVLLYEVVANGNAGAGVGVDVGLYYLAESLFQKADYAAARTYFTRIVDDVGTASRYY